MKKQSHGSQDRSIKTAVFFTVIVFLLISISLLLKATAIVRASTYDPDHRYTVVIYESAEKAAVLSIEKKSNALTLLEVSAKGGIKPIERTVGVPVDGVLSGSLSDTGTIDTFLLRQIMTVSKERNNMTAYDILRLYFFIKPRLNTLVHDTFSIDDQTDTEKTIGTVLNDTAISQENVSVEVVNASDTSGVGHDIERMVTIAGGNVVSIVTATEPVLTSQLEYSGEKTYTVQRLGQLFHLASVKRDNLGVADIRVTIGKADATLTFLR